MVEHGTHYQENLSSYPVHSGHSLVSKRSSCPYISLKEKTSLIFRWSLDTDLIVMLHAKQELVKS